MPRATRTIFRAAGGLLLAGGLCIFGAAALCAQTTPPAKPQAKPQASTKTSSPSRTSTTKKPISSTSKRRGAASARTRMQMAPTSDRIKEIQSALAKAGVYQGEPTGKWDDSTTEAMKRFQVSNGLQPTGKLGALSLQKLGLGSETAGRGAPRLTTPAAASTSSNTPRLP